MRQEVLTAEKRRLEAIDKNILAQSGAENGDPNTPNSPTQSERRGQILTPLQAEFRSRMRGALLNIPLDDSTTRTPSSAYSFGQVSDAAIVTPNISNFATPESKRNVPKTDLVYANLSPSESDITSNRGAARMLSFQSSKLSGSSNASTLTEHAKISPNLSKNSLKRDASHFSSRVTPDPYSLDQLHVLDRSSRMDNASLYDTGLRAVSNKVARRINSSPTRILDAPELVDDYYLNLLSWGKNNILAVALGQCVYLWNAETGDIQHLLTLQGQDDFVTSIRWADMAGHTNCIAVGTNEGPVQL